MSSSIALEHSLHSRMYLSSPSTSNALFLHYLSLTSFVSLFRNFTELSRPRTDGMYHLISHLTKLQQVTYSGPVQSLLPSAASLRRLNLSFKPSVDAEEIETIRAFSNLTSLTVKGVQLSEKSLEKICESLCLSLRVLSLSDAGLIESLRPFTACCQLVSLNLNGCRITTSELAHITHLQHLV